MDTNTITEKRKDFLNDGLDTVEKVMDVIQESYDSLPDKKKSKELLITAGDIIKSEIGDNYQCKFSHATETIIKVSKKRDWSDPEKIYKKLQRAVSKDIRECFSAEYGDIM